MGRNTLVQRINKYLRRHGLSATRFGREAVGDPSIVFDLRSGRRPRPPLERRLVAWLDARTDDKESRRCSR